MANHASTHTLKLQVYDEDGEVLETITLRLVVGFNPGSPESGRFGPVENYDPGSGDEFWIGAVARVLEDGTLRELSPAERTWAETWVDKNEDGIAESACDCPDPRDEYDPHEAAMERERDLADSPRDGDE